MKLIFDGSDIKERNSFSKKILLIIRLLVGYRVKSYLTG